MRTNKGRISGLMALLLFCVFAICVLLTLLLGTEVYSNLVERDRDSNSRNLPLQYLSTRIRQADRQNGISIDVFDGVDALVFREEFDGEVYLTFVYCYDGWLCELFSAEGSGLLPEDGEHLLPLESMSLQSDGSTIHIDLSHSDGQRDSLNLTLRHRGEATP